MGGHVLDGTDRHGGQGEGHAEGLGRAGGLDLAIGGLHAGKPHGRQRDRHGHGLPQHLPRHDAIRHIDRHLLAKTDLAEIADVFAESLFGIAARFRIIIEHPRDAARVQPFQIFNAGDDGHGRKPPIWFGFLTNIACFLQCGLSRPGKKPAPGGGGGLDRGQPVKRAFMACRRS